MGMRILIKKEESTEGEVTKKLMAKQLKEFLGL